MADKTTEFTPADLEATADGALAALERVGARAEALVGEWVSRGNAAAVAIAAECATSTARKAARRGVNVLRSRGVAIPERNRIAKLGGAEEAETQEAWLMAPDGAGNVALVLASRTRTSRYLSAVFILNDGLGLGRVDLAETSQSGLRDMMARMLPGGDTRPISVPVEWARWRVAEARKRNAERRIPEPLGVSSAQKLMDPVPAQAPSHPFEEEGLVVADEDAKEMSRTSGRLHGWPEFRGWFPPPESVQEMMFKVGETIRPGEEPKHEELQQTLEREVCAATDRYFSPDRRDRLIALMKDSALSVLQRAGEEAALEVAATMKSVQAAGLITDPPHQVPFLRAFFDKAVAVMVAQGGGQLRIPVRGQPVAPETSLAEGEADLLATGNEAPPGEPT
jgi:hypothetical protein